MKTSRTPSFSLGGFTLVELMVSTAILAGLMVLLLNTVDQTQRVWTRATAKASQFQAARGAFESMTRRMSQATLNTYWRAYDVYITSNKADLKFRRQSELQFISGPTAEIFKANNKLTGLSSPIETAYPTHAVFFQAPLGYTEEKDPAKPTVSRFRSMDEMLVGCGYFIEYGPDPDRPPFINSLTSYPEQRRFRLMELTVPGELLDIYNRYETKDKLSRSMIDPRVYDMKNQFYKGLVDLERKPNKAWVPPLWMEDALVRDPIPGATKGNRFRFAHVRAENIIALIILPKLAPKDRTPAGTDRLDLAPGYRFDSWRILAGGSVPDEFGRTVDNTARDNLLPPIVQVTMVAVDETSMKRLQQSDDPIPFTEGLFQTVSSERDYKEDIERLEKDLIARKLNYRIFSTDVVIRGSKWSHVEPKRAAK